MIKPKGFAIQKLVKSKLQSHIEMLINPNFPLAVPSSFCSMVLHLSYLLSPTFHSSQQSSRCYTSMKSSLALQLLLYLGSYYCGAFLIIEFLLLIYKSIILPYPAGNLLSEVTKNIKHNPALVPHLLFCHTSLLIFLQPQCLLLVMLCCVEVCRVLSGWKGNLIENTSE